MSTTSARPIVWALPLSLALATVVLCANSREAGVRQIVVLQPAQDPGDVVVSTQYSNPDSFIFLKGRYLRQPYEMVIAESTLYLNGRVLMQHPKLRSIMSGAVYEGVLPAKPKALRADSSWDEIDKMPDGGRPWATKVMFYFLCHYAPDEAAQRLEEEIQSWPFVKSIRVIPAPAHGEGRRYLSVESHAGDTRDFFSSWWKPGAVEDWGSSVWGPTDFRPYTRAEIRTALEERRDSYVDMIRAGELVVLDESGSIRLPRHGTQGARASWEQIVNVVRILESNLSRELKVRQIAHHIVADAIHRQPGMPDKRIVQGLVDGYFPDAQLTNRVRTLEKKVWIPLWSEQSVAH